MMWNKKTEPLHTINVGPGTSFSLREIERFEQRVIMDLEIGDIDNDKRIEIFAALKSKRILTLDHKLKLLWSRNIEDTPNVIKYVKYGNNRFLIVACKNGQLLFLNAKGEIEYRCNVSYEPIKISYVQNLLVITTKNNVTFFNLENVL